MSLNFNSIAGAVAALSVVVFHSDAQAYLNPGTGSMILQAVIAGFAVLSVTIKIYWYKLKAYFKGETYDPDEDLLADLDLDDEDAEDSGESGK